MIKLDKEKIEFTCIHAGNIKKFKKIRNMYIRFSAQSLKNQGQKPYGKRFFTKQFNSTITNCTWDEHNKVLDKFVIIHSGKEIIGFSFFGTKELGQSGHIAGFYIDKKYRRRGYGTQLYNYTEKLFEGYGFNKIYLEPDMVTGIDFWADMGYSPSNNASFSNRHKNTYEKNIAGTPKELIELRQVTLSDAEFLTALLNNKAVMKALNEKKSTLKDWQASINKWDNDNAEKNYIIYCDNIPIGWVGVNLLLLKDNKPNIKKLVLYPEYRYFGIGQNVIRQINAEHEMQRL